MQTLKNILRCHVQEDNKSLWPPNQISSSLCPTEYLFKIWRHFLWALMSCFIFQTNLMIRKVRVTLTFDHQIRISSSLSPTENLYQTWRNIWRTPWEYFFKFVRHFQLDFRMKWYTIFVVKCQGRCGLTKHFIHKNGTDKRKYRWTTQKHNTFSQCPSWRHTVYIL